MEELEKKVQRMEKIYERLQRRSRKVAKAMITPYPISSGILDNDGVIGDVLRYMFPCDGKITKGMITLDRKPKTGIELKIDIDNDEGGNAVYYSISKRNSVVELDMIVHSGDRMTVTVNPLSEDDFVTAVWVAFLFVPEMKELDIKQFLIEELENVSEE